MSEHSELRQGRVEGILEQVAARLESMEATHRQELSNLRQDMRQDMATIHHRLETIEINHRRDFRLLGVMSAQIVLALKRWQFAG